MGQSSLIDQNVWFLGRHMYNPSSVNKNVTEIKSPSSGQLIRVETSSDRFVAEWIGKGP
jgi:hypothetical protein